jgi:hypothetical protein
LCLITQRRHNMSYYKSRQSMVRGRNGLYQNGTTNNEVETEVETDVDEVESTQPTVSFNIPTLIRVLEMVREDVVSDNILHFVVEKIIEVGADQDAIDMDDYEEIASVVPARMMIAQRRSKDGRRI